MSEFDLIERYFRKSIPRDDVIVGNGDDCAVTSVPAGHQLTVSVDTLVEGVHFLPEVDPFSLGYKALAVSLSDLASMASVPRWATLALTIPEPDDAWLSAFSDGFHSLAEQFNVALVGGDTTRGPLSITVQLMGTVLDGKAVTRGGAQLGDDIYVTGQLGDAAIGLKCAQGEYMSEPHLDHHCRMRLERPEPRISSGVGLGPFVSAMVDCSDGFAADLGHILSSSGCGAVVKRRSLPISEAGRQFVENSGDWAPIVSGGDDYELIFTASPDSRTMISAIAEATGCSITWVGTVTSHDQLVMLGDDDLPLENPGSGYTHF